MKQKKKVIKKKEKKKAAASVRIALDLPPEVIELLDGLAVRFGSTRKRQAELLLCRKVPQVMAELKKSILGVEYCMTRPQLEQTVRDILEQQKILKEKGEKDVLGT